MSDWRHLTEDQKAAIIRKRRAWLSEHHQDVTREEAAEHFNVSQSTIAWDEKAMKIRCKAKERKEYERASVDRGALEAHVRWVSEWLRAWKVGEQA